MRMRKRKWIDPYLENENVYLIKDAHNFKNVYLEIGMGMGDFITASAKENPDIFYIGLERIDACVARAIKKARELNLENIRIIRADAVHLTELFEEKSFSLSVFASRRGRRGTAFIFAGVGARDRRGT